MYKWTTVCPAFIAIGVGHSWHLAKCPDRVRVPEGQKQSRDKERNSLEVVLHLSAFSWLLVLLPFFVLVSFSLQGCGQPNLPGPQQLILCMFLCCFILDGCKDRASFVSILCSRPANLCQPVAFSPVSNRARSDCQCLTCLLKPWHLQ